MKTVIEGVSAIVGREKISFAIPRGKTVKYLEVQLSNGVSFDVEVDKDGDVVITGSGKIKVLSEVENELILKIKQQKELS